MKGLLVKDMELLMQQKKFFIVVFVVGAVLSFSGSATFAIGYFTILIATFATTTVSYDEYENGFAFLMTLPVTRKEYIKEKYFLGISLSVAAWFLGMIIEGICYMVQSMDQSFFEFIISAAAMIPVGLLMVALILPFIIKYGAEKGRYMALGILVVVFAAIVMIPKTLGLSETAITGALDSVLSIGVFPVLLIAVALVFVIYYISYRISTGIMNKKEF